MSHRVAPFLLVLAALLTVACSEQTETTPGLPAAPPEPASEAPGAGTDAGPTFGDETRPPAPKCESSPDAEHLEDHACFHVAEGPFATLAAGSPGSPAVLARTHTAYTVTVSARGSRWVSFRAKASSTYAFLLGGEAQVDTFVPDGALVTPTCEGESTGICAGLPRKVLVKVSAGQTLLLGLTPASGAELLVVVEDAG